MSWVLRHSPVTTPGHRLVLLVLADHANDGGDGAWPSIDTIAEQAKQSRRNVQYALRALEGTGAIARTGESPYGTTIWRVEMAGAEGGAKFAPRATVAPDPSEPPTQQLVGEGTNGSDGSGAKPAPPAAPGGASAARRAWARITPLLQQEVTDFIWHIWLEPLEPIAVDHGKLTLGAPMHLCGWVRDRYVDAIAAAAEQAAGHPVEITLELLEAGAAPAAAPEQEARVRPGPTRRPGPERASHPRAAARRRTG